MRKSDSHNAFGLLFLIFQFSIFNSQSQTLGGNSVFNFLKLGPSPAVSSLGGVQPSAITNDATACWNNPALMNKTNHQQVSTSFNFFLADIKNLYAQYNHHLEKQDLNVSGSISYFNYGSTPQTDAVGNVQGNFRANDYTVTLSAAKEFVPRFSAGIHVKYINSNYGGNVATGIAADVGLTYTDSVQLFRFAIVARNMGQQLSVYQNGSKDELPFDVQVGVTKRLAKAPIQFSLAWQQAHRWDIYYNDSAFTNENGLGEGKPTSFFNKLSSHLVLGVQLFLSKNIDLGLGYNFLRRKEQSLGNAGNGLAGFSGGLGITYKQFQFRYATGLYVSNMANHQVGITLNMERKL
ncbi:MAG: type IX secretion system protein PorQ [Bacteroidota bacterium]